MSIWREAPAASTAPSDSPAVVTVGNFDGVHRGHQHVLERAKDEGARLGLPVTTVTFDPHPVDVLAPNHAPARLTTLPRRIDLLLEHGADVVRVLGFNEEIAAWPPESFIERIVIDELRAAAVIVGKNFRFGHKAAGDIALLSEYGKAHGFDVIGLDLEGAPMYDGPESQLPYSSTLARRLIGGGDLPAAADVLGRPHEICGDIMRGDGRGRELGYPTANMPVDESYAVPPDGVYAGWLVDTAGHRLPNAISVGTNPTFNGRERRIESHIVDSDDLDLYDTCVRVELIEQLRPMQRFDSVDALVRQMDTDVDAARHTLHV